MHIISYYLTISVVEFFLKYFVKFKFHMQPSI